jgi:hypothetical protein
MIGSAHLKVGDCVELLDPRTFDQRTKRATAGTGIVGVVVAVDLDKTVGKTHVDAGSYGDFYAHEQFFRKVSA